MTVVAADPEELRHAAEQVRIAAEEISRSVGARAGGLAVPGQRGWRTAGELGAAAAAWEEHLRRLAATLAEMAVDLEVVTATLVAADEDANARWGSVPVQARGMAVAR